MDGLGEKLRQRARALGLSDTEVARRLGMSQARYANYVSDKREPDLRTLAEICRILAISPNHLLSFARPDTVTGLEESGQPYRFAGEVPAKGETAILRERIHAAAEAMGEQTLRTAATVMDALVRAQGEE